MRSGRDVKAWIWKLPVCGLAFFLATAVTAAILTMAGLHRMAMPPGFVEQKSTLYSLALCPLVAAGLAPLAAGLSGGFRARWLTVALLVWINMAVNMAIELAIFSTLLANGGAAFLVLMYAGAAAALGAATAHWFGPSERPPAEVPRRGAAGWTWRIAAAVLAFPVIYLVFGMMVSPIVVERYRAGIAGLVLPPMSVIVSVQILRSALFLAGSAAAIFLWAGTRRGLVLALGWAHLVTVGLYGLLSGYWLPAALRIAHSLEITADSFVYALVIVLLLKRGTTAPERAAQVDGAVPVSAA